MLFSSISFLYYFLPAVLVLYFVVPKCLKNTVLLLSGLVFYAWGEPIYVFLMIGSILFAYVMGLLTQRFRRQAKLFLVLSVAVNLGLLAFFKYTDFFITNFNAATGLSLPLLRISLPIGISFYTFQTMSYNIDVYRGTVSAQRNPISLGAYVSMFPQLIAGPIVRYSDINDQLNSRTHSLEDISAGIRRFIIGLGKKVLIANTLGELTDLFRNSQDLSVLFFWLYAIAFCLQIYFDFSGYSDMAIGLGRIFGFRFSENFNYPFVSSSITEFWRRWHISLGTWFRDYVYIPLGGNRVKLPRHFLNIFVVWFLTGFWHGASWNFILWGLYFAVLLMAEKFFLLKHLEKSRVLSHVYVMLLVVFSFVLFNADGLSGAVHDLGGMFGAGGIPAISAESIYYLRSYLLIFLLAIIGATPLPKRFTERFRSNAMGAKIMNIAEPVFCAVLLLVVTAYLVDGSFNPFLYFRF